MKVTPIIAPAFDWRQFVVESHAALGRSPTASLNMAGLKPGPLKTVIPALGEFQREHSAALPYLKGRECDPVLAHLHVSFLVEAEADSVTRLLALAKLDVITPDDCPTVAVVTGSLRDWRDMVVANSRLRSDPRVRALASEIHECLVRAGLADLFADCVTRKHQDGTTLLEKTRER